MPGTYLHYFFAKNFMSDTKFLNPEMINIGAQGADILFFYGQVFFYRKRKIRYLGNFLHKEFTFSHIKKMIEYAQNIADEVEKNTLFSYIFGYCIHYILDRNIHPYVYYYSYPSNQKKLYKSDHVLFETYLDMEIAKINKDFINFPKILKTSRKKVKKISEMYHFIEPSMKKKSFYKAYKEMVFIRRWTHKNYFIKHFFNFFGLKNSSINCALYPKYFDNDIDVLNLKKEKYCIPDTGEISDFSVFDLIEKSKKEVQFVRKLLLKYYQNSTDFNDLIFFINNKNFDGINLENSKHFKSKFYVARNKNK